MFRLFVALSLVAVLAAPSLAGTFPVLAGGGVEGDAQTSLVYNAADGTLSTDPPAGGALSSINIDSAGSMFDPTKADATVFSGSFDTTSAGNLFKATFGDSFGAVNMGAVLPTGLAADVLIADLSAIGSLNGGGGLDAVDLVCLNCDGGGVGGDYKTFPEGIGDEQTSIVYRQDGTVEVDAPASTQLSSINVNSAGSLFVEANFDAANFDGSFDTTTTGNFFKATFGGSFPSFVVGNAVMPAGMTPEAVMADLGITAGDPTGSLDGGGGLGAVDLIYEVPEPSALILLGLGVLGLAIRRRR